MNYEEKFKFAHLDFALRKALHKNKKENIPSYQTKTEYLNNLQKELRSGKIELDIPTKFNLSFGKKILEIERCSLKNRIIEYYYDRQIRLINEKYWYQKRTTIFRTGSGLEQYQRIANKLSSDYKFFYLIDLKSAFKINYNKLYQDFLIKNFDEIDLKLIESLLFISSKKSDGLPLGHKLSNILFDCYLIPLEKALENNKFKYLRLIDSFIFFINDKNDLQKINKVFNDCDIIINETKSKLIDKEKINMENFKNEILI